MNILVVVAHPDDEVLGCGGTIAKHVKDGDTVDVVILGGGRGGLENVCREANYIMGSRVAIGDLPDQRFDNVDLLDIIQSLEGSEYDVIYTHDENDLNLDHRIVCEAVKTAFRPLPGRKTNILTFEIPSSSEWGGGFIPNYFVDVTDTVDLKEQALSCYGSEMRPEPHPRSYTGVYSLMRWRGATVGVRYAEAFKVVRMIC